MREKTSEKRAKEEYAEGLQHGGALRGFILSQIIPKSRVTNDLHGEGFDRRNDRNRLSFGGSLCKQGNVRKEDTDDRGIQVGKYPIANDVACLMRCDKRRVLQRLI